MLNLKLSPSLPPCVPYLSGLSTADIALIGSRAIASPLASHIMHDVTSTNAGHDSGRDQSNIINEPGHAAREDGLSARLGSIEDFSRASPMLNCRACQGRLHEQLFIRNMARLHHISPRKVGRNDLKEPEGFEGFGMSYQVWFAGDGFNVIHVFEGFFLCISTNMEAHLTNDVVIDSA